MINKLRSYLNDCDTRIKVVRYITINPTDYKTITADKDYCKATDSFCGVPLIINNSLKKGDIETWA